MVQKRSLTDCFRVSYLQALLLGTVVAFSWPQDVRAERRLDFVRLVQFIEIDPASLSEPAGLAYLSKADQLLIVEQSRGTANLLQMSRLHELAGTIVLPDADLNPLNITYDARYDRLLLLQPESNQLIEMSTGSDGVPRSDVISHIDTQGFGTPDTQGMTIDPLTGTLYMLDGLWSVIVRVEPDTLLGFKLPTISEIDLSPLYEFELRGIAFDPTTGHLFILDPQNLRLYEVTDTGTLVSNRDVSGIGLSNPQAMVFAPSGDLTDDPYNLSLYIVSRGDLTAASSAGVIATMTGGISELSLTK